MFVAAPPLPAKAGFRRVQKKQATIYRLAVKAIAFEAVYLCCTFPEVAFGGRYPLSLPCGARTFLIRHLSVYSARDCPTYSQGLL